MDVEPSSPLGSLKAIHDQVAAKLFLDLAVPRYDNPKIVVRYRALDKDDLARVRRVSRQVKPGREIDAALRANVDSLIEACIGVYAVMGDDKLVLDRENPEQWLPFNPDEPGADWVRFDETLGAALGVTEQRAASVLEKLFQTDGDISSHADELFKWSGWAGEQTNEEYAGE